MERLLTDELCDFIAKAGKAHCVAYHTKKAATTKKALARSKDWVEIALGHKLSIVDRRLVRLWLAAKLTVSTLAPEIPWFVFNCLVIAQERQHASVVEWIQSQL